MKNIFKALLYGSIFLCHAIITNAQVPNLFNYQAIARDGNGAVLANQSISIRFTVHDGSAAGAVVYQEKQSKSTNQFGLFTAEVGGGAVVSGTFTSIVWATGDKYLQVEIDPTAGTNFIDIGAAKLLSVPYALYAANGGGGSLTLPFQQAINSSSNAFDVTNNGLGSALKGTANGNAAVGVQGNASAGSGIGVYGLATGSADYGIMGEASGINSVAGFFQANSNVFKPTVSIHELGDDFARINFNNDQNTNFWTLAGYTHTTAPNAKFNFYYYGTGDIMTLQGDGNVGIGTTSPTSKLHITTSDAIYPVLFAENNNLQGYGIKGTNSNFSADSTSYGVYGENLGAGVGILAYSNNGVAVRAECPTGSTKRIALELKNGAIKVTGTNKSAFYVQADYNNSNANGYVSGGLMYLNNPLCNNDPYALLFITPRIGGSGISTFGVFYDSNSGKWIIGNISSVPLGFGSASDPIAFNVLVIKQ